MVRPLNYFSFLHHHQRETRSRLDHFPIPLNIKAEAERDLSISLGVPPKNSPIFKEFSKLNRTSNNYTMKIHLLVCSLAWLSKCSMWKVRRVVGENHQIKSVMMSTDQISFSVPTLKNVPYRINQIVVVDKIDAVRFRHIEVATEEMANLCKSLVTEGADFGEIAGKMSLCDMTKNNGGDSGWLNTTNNSENRMTLPLELINAAIYLNKGDMVVTSAKKVIEDEREESLISWHLLQLIDVNNIVNPILRRRKKDNYKSMISRTSSNQISNQDIDLISDDISLTYSIETMGCQMNTAGEE